MFKWYLIFFLVFQFLIKTEISLAQNPQLQLWWEQMKMAELSNLDSALIYNAKYIASAETLKNKALLAKGYKLRGLYFRNKGLYHLSEKNFQIALQYSQTAVDSLQEAMVLVEFSSLKKRQVKFDEAMQYLNTAIQILHSLNESTLLANAYNNLGLVYDKINQSNEAERLYQKALKIVGNKDKELRSKIIENIADILDLEERYEEAITSYQESKANYQDKEDLARINNTIGVAYWNKGETKSAISYFKESETIARQAKNDLLLADALINLGDIYQEENLIELAESYFKEVETLYNKGIGSVEDQKYFAEILAAYYKANQNFKLSVNYLEQVEKFNAAIINENREDKLAQERAELEYALAEMTIQEERLQKQEAQLEAEAQAANFLKALLALLLTITMLCLFAYLYKREQKQRKDQEHAFKKKIEDELIVAKLKGEKLGRKRIAGELHDDISTILVAIKRDLELGLLKLKKGKDIIPELQDTVQITDKAYHKVRNLSHKLEPAPSAWQDDMDIHIRLLEDNEQITIVKSIDVERPISQHVGNELAKIVAVLLHNIEKHAQATEVFLELTSFDEGINLIVVDNGIGFDAGKVEEMGVGLKSVIRRVKDLEGDYNIDTRLGTTIAIDIPLPYIPKKPKKSYELNYSG